MDEAERELCADYNEFSGILSFYFVKIFILGYVYISVNILYCNEI